MTFQEVVVGGVLRAGLRTYRLTPPIRAGYKGRFILLLEAATLVFPARHGTKNSDKEAAFGEAYGFQIASMIWNSSV